PGLSLPVAAQRRPRPAEHRSEPSDHCQRDRPVEEHRAMRDQTSQTPASAERETAPRDRDAGLPAAAPVAGQAAAVNAAPRDHLRGMLIMLLAVAAFSGMDACLKVLTPHYPAIQV